MHKPYMLPLIAYLIIPRFFVDKTKEVVFKIGGQI